jgi:hypothetical protein
MKSSDHITHMIQITTKIQGITCVSESSVGRKISECRGGSHRTSFLIISYQAPQESVPDMELEHKCQKLK